MQPRSSRHGGEWRWLLRRTRFRGAGDNWRLLREKATILRRATPAKLANAAALKLQKRLGRMRLRGMPYRYKIDPTNRCSLRCPLCPTGRRIGGRPRGTMDLDLYRRLLSEIAPWAVTLDLFGWGEPLLHPRITTMISLAASHGIYTRLSTSLNTEDPSLPAALVASGLDAIIVGLDGATEETYRRYRRGGDLWTVTDNIRRLAAARQRTGRATPLLIARMLVHSGNEHDIAATRRLARRLGADVFTVSPVFLDPADRPLAERWRPLNRRLDAYAGGAFNRGQCSDLWESLVINWDGGVSPCCWIHRRDRDLGDCRTATIRELWNGPAFVAARAAVLGRATGDPAPHIYCRQCRGRPDYLADIPAGTRASQAGAAAAATGSA